MKATLNKLAIMLMLLLSFSAHAAIKIVAAENVYGELAKFIGGPGVQVDNILANPNQDPHLFTATTKTAKQIADAQIIIYNGAGYDTWLEKLLAANKKEGQQLIEIASLVNAAPGANPHLWYQPNNMLMYAQALANALSQVDDKNHSFYQQQLAIFKQDYSRLMDRIQELKQKYAGFAVTATEPVFEYMADELGLKMHGIELQQSIMNDVEPSPQQIKKFTTLLSSRYVKLMFYNSQVTNPFTEQLKQLAITNGIPVVGVGEVQPADTDYINWMLLQLNSLDKALQDTHHDAS